VTAAVDGLVERGWLARSPVPDDRRAVRIALTASGRAALGRSEAAMANRLAAILEAAGEPEGTLEVLAALAPALAVVGAAR
jgi:DNA-binding MarR family transcriptional regulator